MGMKASWKKLTLIGLVLVYLIVTKALNPELEIESSIEINASDEKVWNIIRDFSAYPDWNTYITYIEGDLRPGSALYVETKTKNDNHAAYRSKVTTAIEKRQLSWQGELIISGIYDSEQSLAISSLSENRSRFTIRGSYTGLLVPIFWILVERNEPLDYERMSQEIKIRAEQCKHYDEDQKR